MNRKILFLVILFFLDVILLSALTAYAIIYTLGPKITSSCDSCIRFVPEPLPDNPDHGYLEINGNRYYQIYTTTEVEDDTVPLGSHYHRIDIRGKK